MRTLNSSFFLAILSSFLVPMLCVAMLISEYAYVVLAYAEKTSVTVKPKEKTPKRDRMVLVPGGKFMAGSPRSLKEMVVSEFYIDKYEVTQREYEQVMGMNPSRFTGCPDCPVEQVTWYKANEYCMKVGKRLPTEWEWEKATKAGTTTTFYWGESENMASDYAWFWHNSDKKTHPVGQKKPNAYGLYDMIGNVWEWTSSNYDDSGKNKTIRGGSWYTGATWVGSLGAYDRMYSPTDSRGDNGGFRCAADSR